MRKSPVKPVTIELLDGQEYKLLLTARALEENEAALMAASGDGGGKMKAVNDILWAAVRNKGDMTREQFTELLPGDPQWLTSVMSEVLGVSMPEPRPTEPEAVPVTAPVASTGLN